MDKLKQQAYDKVDRETIAEELSDWLEQRTVVLRAISRHSGTAIEQDWKDALVALETLIQATKDRIQQLIS